MMWLLGNGVLHRLADRELDGRFGRDLDHRSGRRIAAFTCLAGGLFQLAEAGKREFAVLFDFAGSESRKCVEHCFDVRFLCTGRISQAADDLSLCHTSHNS
jgi:hypothetical protein